MENEKKKRGRPFSVRKETIKLTLKLDVADDIFLKEMAEKTGLSRKKTIFKALELLDKEIEKK